MNEQETIEFSDKLFESFPFFLEQVWSEIGLPKPSFVQVDIAEWLQNGPARRGIRGFRGVTKTWLTIAYALWRLLCNHNERITFVSKSEGHSKDSLYLARHWINQIYFLNHLTPRKGQRDTAIKFDIGPCQWDRTASFSAYGIGGQITGARSTLIIADDVETKENTRTMEMRQRLREDVKEFGYIVRPGCDIIFLGTPHSEFTLYDQLPLSGYKFRAWPVRYPTDDQKVPQLAPTLVKRMKDGTNKAMDPMWPEMFSEEVLQTEEKSSGHTTFLMQYMVISNVEAHAFYPLRLGDLICMDQIGERTAPANLLWAEHDSLGRSLRINDLICMNVEDGFNSPLLVDAKWGEYTGTKMWVDPSGRGEDATGYAVISQLHGFLYVREVGALAGGYDDSVLGELAQIALRFDVNYIYVEDNFGAGMMARLFQPVLRRYFCKKGEIQMASGKVMDRNWSAHIESVRVRGQKEIRIIEILEPILNQHRLVIDRHTASNEDFQYQLSRLTRARQSLEKDDVVEALAMCCEQWEWELGQSSDEASERMRDRQMDDMLREFRRPPFNKSPNWLHTVA